MRTSPSQFQILVEYMEKYGDLSKPSEGPRGKILNLSRWTYLCNTLNADATGDTKSLDKWRKVWSDFKNNVKRKAGRIHRSAQGTGGGPASNLRLTEVEERVLRLVGSRVATGLPNIAEVGSERYSNDQPECTVGMQLLPEVSLVVGDWNRPGSSRDTPLFPPSSSAEVVIVDAQLNVQETGPLASATGIEAGQTGSGTVLGHCSPPSLPSTVLLSDTERRHHASQSPTPLPHTPCRRRRARLLNTGSPLRRSRTQTQSELARQVFARSDCEWRLFQQEAERERIRLREVELKMQEKWIDVIKEFLVIFRRISDNLGDR